MTRKDYIIISNVLRDCNEQALTAKDKILLHKVASGLAQDLHRDNPNFDHTRFFNACIPTVSA